MATATRPEFPSLVQMENADVCIVGAGIAGLTTAYLLKKAGHSVVVLDDGPVMSGETQRTSAHLSCVLDDRYVDLERLHGAAGAKLAAESHVAAIDTIERIVREEHIDCDFARVDGYLFHAPGHPEDLLEREWAAAQRAGLVDTELVEAASLFSIHPGRALRFPRQAQFHPLKYLAALTQVIVRDGGRIFAGAHVTNITGGKAAHVETEDGNTVSCTAIVMATNTPINDRLVIHTKQAAYRTFVIGIAIPAGTVPRALYWDTSDPGHYVRVALAKDGEILIVGGEDHKTGQADDADTRYEHLEQWARERFPLANEVCFRWSGQVIESFDGLAFIGRNPLDHDNVFVVTGDSGSGLTHGTIAGLLLSDLIDGRENPWTKLYSPSRLSLGTTVEFAKETANMVAQYANWLTSGDAEKDRLVPLGTGAVVRHGLAKVAVYRDAEGTFHECSAVCPHLGAIVAWNHSEQTWDCPVHGSRFDRLGKVLNGPANQDLHPLQVAALH